MGELIMAIIFLAMSVVFILVAGQFSTIDNMPINSATFPRVVAVLLLIYSSILIIKNIKNLKTKKDLPKIEIKTIIVMLSSIIFYLVFDYLGYIISSILLLVVIAVLLQNKKLKAMDTIVLPVTFVICLYFTFKILKISLPIGKLFY